jgi:hypothetical protein
MKGLYQFCEQQHLHRYLAEFEFRYNNRVALGCNDADRAAPGWIDAPPDLMGNEPIA